MRNRLLCCKTHRKIWTTPEKPLSLQHLKDITITQYLNNAFNYLDLTNIEKHDSQAIQADKKRKAIQAFLFLTLPKRAGAHAPAVFPRTFGPPPKKDRTSSKSRGVDRYCPSRVLPKNWNINRDMDK